MRLADLLLISGALGGERPRRIVAAAVERSGTAAATIAPRVLTAVLFRPRRRECVSRRHEAKRNSGGSHTLAGGDTMTRTARMVGKGCGLPRPSSAAAKLRQYMAEGVRSPNRLWLALRRNAVTGLPHTRADGASIRRGEAELPKAMATAVRSWRLGAGVRSPHKPIVLLVAIGGDDDDRRKEKPNEKGNGPIRPKGLRGRKSAPREDGSGIVVSLSARLRVGECHADRPVRVDEGGLCCSVAVGVCVRFHCGYCSTCGKEGCRHPRTRADGASIRRGEAELPKAMATAVRSWRLGASVRIPDDRLCVAFKGKVRR